MCGRRALRVGVDPQRQAPPVVGVERERRVERVQHQGQVAHAEPEALRGDQCDAAQHLHLAGLVEVGVVRLHRSYGRAMRLPYGTWPSPISPESLATGQEALDEVRVDGRDTYWLAGRPAEGGRTALVCHDGIRQREVLAAPWDVRSRVHEYGGGAYAVLDGTVVFSHAGDDRVHRLDAGATQPQPITPPGPWRFGGLVLHGDHVFAVREDHSRDPEPANELVRLDLHGDNAEGGVVLATGTDFVVAPAAPPTVGPLAWVAWRHPSMPWDSTELLRAELGEQGTGEAVVVAGGDGVRACSRPSARTARCGSCPTSRVVDRAPRHRYRHRPRLHEARADHAAPQWALGMVDLAVVDADRAVVRWWEGAGAALGLLDARTGDVETAARRGRRLRPAPGRRRRAGPAPRPGRPAARGRAGPGRRAPRVLGTAGSLALDPDDVSPAQAWSWTDTDGLTVHGLLHHPRAAGTQGPEGELPPLVVMVHGGPTSRARRPSRCRRSSGPPAASRCCDVELLRQHRLRARLPRAAARRVGPARHRRLRHRCAPRWPRPVRSTRPGSPSAEAAPAGMPCCAR